MTTTTEEQAPLAEATAIEKVPPAPIALSKGGVQLRTVEDMFRFADMVHQSGIAPKGLDNPQAIAVAIEMGAELGIAPMMALQNVAVINGRPSLYGDAQMALVLASGLSDNSAYKEWETGKWPNDDYTVHCQVKRVDSAHPVVRTFSVADAKKARLWGKSGPWSEYPKRQQRWRALGWALRDCFPDVLRGTYSEAESRDLPVTPIAADVISVTTLPSGDPPKSQTEQLTDKLKAKATGKPKPEPAPEPEVAEATITTVQFGTLRRLYNSLSNELREAFHKQMETGLITEYANLPASQYEDVKSVLQGMVETP